MTGDKWFAPFVYAAKEAGLINGVSEELFMPDQNITREDATVIFYRLLSLKGAERKKGADFKDFDAISDYAEDAVEYMAGSGIIKGSDGKFNPKNNLTRAEAVTLLSRVADLIK